MEIQQISHQRFLKKIDIQTIMLSHFGPFVSKKAGMQSQLHALLATFIHFDYIDASCACQPLLCEFVQKIAVLLFLFGCDVHY